MKSVDDASLHDGRIQVSIVANDNEIVKNFVPCGMRVTIVEESFSKVTASTVHTSTDDVCVGQTLSPEKAITVISSKGSLSVVCSLHVEATLPFRDPLVK